MLVTYHKILRTSLLFFQSLNLIFYTSYRAKQSRRAMIKHQIETMLNIKGKDMPSVEEEFGSSGTSHFDISKHRYTLNYICMTSNIEHLFLS